MSDREPTREPGRVYIDELAKIVHRKVDTVRKWEKDDKLPQHLRSRRGTRNWRYWTDAQVYGPRGIIKWMRSNDMRPGRVVTSPDREDVHIDHLRKPKAIPPIVLEQIKMRAMIADSGRRKGKSVWTRQGIIKHFFPSTRYANEANFERAVVRYFAEQGWPFPPPTETNGAKPKKRPRRRAKVQRVPRELRDLDREADRLIRITKK